MLRTILCLTLATLLTPALNAQVYTIITNAGTPFTNITGTGSVQLADLDDSVTAPINMGFNFAIYGTTYSNVVLSSNGNLQFGGTPDSFWVNDNLTTTATLNGSHFVAPWWDDLDSETGFTPPAGRVFTQTIGASGSRVFIAQWEQWGHNNDGPNEANTITFQVKLFEGSNNIAFIYTDKVFPFTEADNGLSATIGISPGPFDDPSRPVAQFSFDTASLGNVNDLLFTTAAVPEPTTFALFGAAAGVGYTVRRIRMRRLKKLDQ